MTPLLYEIAAYILSFYLKVFHRFQVYGAHHLPKNGPVIVVSNHANFIDPIVVGCSLRQRQVCFMAKEELFRIPIFRSLLPGLGTFPVRRGRSDRTAIRAAFEVLKQGKVLGMFPEGTRYRDGQLHPLRQGASLLAAETGASILPMIIRGTQKLKLFHFPQIKVYIGEAFALATVEPKKEMVLRGTAEIYTRLRALWENTK
ncbi:MAG TPA: 1-acyl-sn-glycerol-3-phosphate acyltransferase [Firmicutes bacterium]|nr:1-acyl-sn-glycerol-3-phosphate acyltransferase [Bacillota bacterium]